jgi:hypothetical protein
VSLPGSAGRERFADAGTTLKILDAVERGESRSQRTVARDAEVALGFANAYLRRCIRKGWIKVRTAPARRFVYYVTPAGFLEKARMTAEYLSSSFDMFRAARSQCDELLDQCVQQGYRRIALIGASDLAEIAILSAFSRDIEIVAVIDARSNQVRHAGTPIVRMLADAGTVDAVIVTDIRNPQQTYEEQIRNMAEPRVFTPAMLRVNRGRKAVSSSKQDAAP